MPNSGAMNYVYHYQPGQELQTALGVTGAQISGFLNPITEYIKGFNQDDGGLSITGANGQPIYGNGSFSMPGYSDAYKAPQSNLQYNAADPFENTQRYMNLYAPYLSSVMQNAYTGAEGSISGASRGFSGARKWAGQQAANATATNLNDYLKSVNPMITAQYNTPLTLGADQAKYNTQVAGSLEQQRMQNAANVYGNQLGALSGLAQQGYSQDATRRNSILSALASLYGSTASGAYGSALGGYFGLANTVAGQQQQYNPG